MSHDEAIQEVLVLRQQVAELRSAQPPLTGFYQSQPGKPGRKSTSALAMSDLSQAFEMSENLVRLMFLPWQLTFIFVRSCHLNIRLNILKDLNILSVPVIVTVILSIVICITVL